MNFQATVLKILVSYPGGFAAMADLKQDMMILATSGREWAERTKRLAARVRNLDIFSQGLVERLNGGWRITEKGRAVLDVMEARHPDPKTATDAAHVDASDPSTSPPRLPVVARRATHDHYQPRQTARERARAKIR